MTYPWSISALDDGETCPLKYFEVKVAKRFKDTNRKHAEEGIFAHEALAAAIKDNKPLPETIAHYDKWLHQARRHKEIGARILVEEQFALDEDLTPTDWWGDKCWYRGVVDFAAIYEHDGVAFADDYKTGKPKEGSVQLMLMSQCLFSCFPRIEAVVTRFIWLKYREDPPVVYKRSDMPDHWSLLLPRVERFQQMKAEARYPPRPNGLCRNYCPVTTCQYHGKGGHGR